MKWNRIHLLFSMMVCLILSACSSNPDLETLKAEILQLHQDMLEAHQDKDVAWFTRDISDDYFSVGRGEVRLPQRDEIAAQFDHYLNNTQFTEYKDLQEPIIGISRDGSLGWSIVNVRVAGSRKMVDGVVRNFDNVWAWITLYERQGDKWIRLGEVSSVKDEE